MRRWIEITTYLPCIHNCSYCPQKSLGEAYQGEKVMSVETFKKILKNIPNDVEIHFSGFSEPYGHPDIEEFFKLASESHEVCLYTSINKRPSIPLKEYVHNPVNSVQNPISRASHIFDVKREGSQCARSPEFMQNVCLPNGDVTLCCMCYSLEDETYMGSLLKTNFNNLNRKKTYNICRKCESFI